MVYLLAREVTPENNAANMFAPMSYQTCVYGSWQMVLVRCEQRINVHIIYQESLPECWHYKLYDAHGKITSQIEKHASLIVGSPDSWSNETVIPKVLRQIDTVLDLSFHIHTEITVPESITCSSYFKYCGSYW